MNLIIAPVIVSLACYVINRIRKKDLSPYYYIFIFISVFFTALIFGKLSANEDFTKYNINLESVFRAIKKDGKVTLSEEEIQMCNSEIKRHKESGNFCYKSAKERCILIPEQSDYNKAKYCFSTALGFFAPSDPKSKIIAAIISLFTFYGLDCLDEWILIQHNLRLSMYHFEMAEFYNFLLEKGK